jgi:hypothetical protein
MVVKYCVEDNELLTERKWVWETFMAMMATVIKYKDKVQFIELTLETFAVLVHHRNLSRVH